MVYFSIFVSILVTTNPYQVQWTEWRNMKIFFKKTYETPEILEDDFATPSLREDLEKTRQALDIAYAGFDNAVNPDMIDCYIYEINALLKRYKHLSELYALQISPATVPSPSYEHSPVGTLTGHVFS